MTEEEITINLKISKSLYERLEKQLELLKTNNIAALQDASTVEDLIMFYLEHCTVGDTNMKKLEERMQSVLDTLKNEGIDIMDLFNNFHKKMKEEKTATEEKEEEKKTLSREKKKN